MCAQVTQYRRKRASVSSALTAIQPVKERKKSKGGPDLAAANRKLQAMSDIPHTGTAASVNKNKAKFAKKFIFGVDQPSVEADEYNQWGAPTDLITMEAAEKAAQFWYEAYLQGDAFLMAMATIPLSFDRQDKSKTGRCKWWIAIVCAAASSMMLGAQV